MESHKATKPQRWNSTEIESYGRIAIDCGYHLHKELGPGLLESVYEMVLYHSLIERGLAVERQVPVSITFKKMRFENAFKADLVVERSLIIELKSTQLPAPVHGKQLLTYLRLTNLPLGYVMNFGMYSFKEGTKRVVNDYYRDIA